MSTAPVPGPWRKAFPMNKHLTRRAFAATATLATLALAVTACSAGSSTSSASAGGPASTTLQVGLGAAPANLDMTQTAGAAIPQALMENVYEGLVKLGADGTVKPLLAKSWKVSDDRKTYDFQLQSGVKFSNGDAFTADNVKFSLERVKTWKANTPVYLKAIDHVEVVSPTEAKVVLTQPDNNVLYWLAGPLGAMFSPNAVADLANTAIGTGPYTLSAYNRGESLVLKRNDAYWGTKAKLSEVTLRYYSDANAPVNALRSGDLDVVYQTQAYDQVKQFQSDKQFAVSVGTTQGVVVMSMNNQKAPFDDKRVRQAVMYGIDRDAVNTTAVGGYGKLIAGPVPATDPWSKGLKDQYPYDPTKAKQLLAEAGKTNLTVDFAVPSLPYAQSIAQVVKSDLAKVGITVNLQTQEFPAVWLDKTFKQHDYQLTVVNHVEPRSITNYGSPSYYWAYNNPAVTAQLAAAAAAGSDAEYASDMHQAAQTIADDAAGDWLYNAPNIVIAKPDVKGIQKNDLGVALDLTGVSRS